MYAPKWPANGLRAVSGFDQPHIVTKYAGTRGVLAECAELAAHLAGPVTSDIVLKHGNTGPTWKALFDSDRNLDSKKFNRKVIMDGNDYRFGDQAQEFWYPMYRAWGPLFNEVWSGKTSFMQAADEAVRLSKLIVEMKTLHPPKKVLQAKL